VIALLALAPCLGFESLLDQRLLLRPQLARQRAREPVQRAVEAALADLDLAPHPRLAIPRGDVLLVARVPVDPELAGIDRIDESTHADSLHEPVLRTRTLYQRFPGPIGPAEESHIGTVRFSSSSYGERPSTSMRQSTLIDMLVSKTVSPPPPSGPELGWSYTEWRSGNARAGSQPRGARRSMPGPSSKPTASL
jgi:hypothetical protein